MLLLFLWLWVVLLLFIQSFKASDNVVVVVVHVVLDPTNLPFKFGQNRVRNGRDIDKIKFCVVVCGALKSFSCQPNF